MFPSWHVQFVIILNGFHFYIVNIFKVWIYHNPFCVEWKSSLELYTVFYSVFTRTLKDESLTNFKPKSSYEHSSVTIWFLKYEVTQNILFGFLFEIEKYLLFQVASMSVVIVIVINFRSTHFWSLFHIHFNQICHYRCHF